MRHGRDDPGIDDLGNQCFPEEQRRIGATNSAIRLEGLFETAFPGVESPVFKSVFERGGSSVRQRTGKILFEVIQPVVLSGDGLAAMNDRFRVNPAFVEKPSFLQTQGAGTASNDFLRHSGQFRVVVISPVVFYMMHLLDVELGDVIEFCPMEVVAFLPDAFRTQQCRQGVDAVFRLPPGNPFKIERVHHLRTDQPRKQFRLRIVKHFLRDTPIFLMVPAESVFQRFRRERNSPLRESFPERIGFHLSELLMEIRAPGFRRIGCFQFLSWE